MENISSCFMQLNILYELWGIVRFYSSWIGYSFGHLCCPKVIKDLYIMLITLKNSHEHYGIFMVHVTSQLHGGNDFDQMYVLESESMWTERFCESSWLWSWYIFAQWNWVYSFDLRQRIFLCTNCFHTWRYYLLIKIIKNNLGSNLTFMPDFKCTHVHFYNSD